MKKKITLAILVSLGGLFAFYFLFLAERALPGGAGGGGPHDGHDHADHELIEAPASADLGRSKQLRDPLFQQPADDPLVKILSRKKLLSGSFVAPRISADGKHLLVSGEGYRGLWVARRDGTGLKKISDGQMAGWRPVTTRNGDLIYRTVERDQHGNISFIMHRYNFETGDEEVMYTSGPNEDVYPPWLSRDEDVLFIRRDGEISALPLGFQEGAVPLKERDEGIAYADLGQVWYQHLSQDEPIALSTDTEATGGEVASPDGTRVAYLSGNTDSVLIVDLTTGAEIDIGEGSNLSWHPEGELLLYDVVNDDGHVFLDSQLFVVGADGKNPQRITFGEGSVINPSWSPDGNAIVAETLDGDIVQFEVAVQKNPTSK